MQSSAGWRIGTCDASAPTTTFRHQIACVYAVLGETDKAMAWLERSVDTGFACWPFFKIDPHLQPLREKAEFKRLVADLEYKYTALKIQKV